MTIKLSELQAARAAMTLSLHADAGSRRVSVRGADGREMDALWFDDYRDADGLVATCNSADVLIAIAKAARTWATVVSCDDADCHAVDDACNALLEVVKAVSL